uniref:C2H2-type domain-containing protein n=1 Tax=Panagrellus redivivus TaxID=6233 RepID=A0A7E4VMU5_PANRE
MRVRSRELKRSRDYDGHHRSPPKHHKVSRRNKSPKMAKLSEVDDRNYRWIKCDHVQCGHRYLRREEERDEHSLKAMFDHAKLSSQSSLKHGESSNVKKEPMEDEPAPKLEKEAPTNEMPQSESPQSCICDTDGTCYMLTSSYVLPYFLPYCSPDNVCGTYVVLGLSGGNSNTDGLKSVTGSTLITVAEQADASGVVKPVTDPAFINAATISCDGCVQSYCKTPDD